MFVIAEFTGTQTLVRLRGLNYKGGIGSGFGISRYSTVTAKLQIKPHKEPKALRVKDLNHYVN
ncbi:hypothetical protein NIES4073_54380 [Kalymmatonema gypsitolerans NIES-4073]|nr:hypothetical protein NIES4073_54380 [Scytonema sp. NIES-4073]